VGDHNAPHRRQHSLIEHWNGSHWSVVHSPNTTCHQNYLLSVAMLSAGYGFAVGSTGYCHHPVEQTLIERWNGSSWRIVSSPNAASYGTYLGAIALVSRKAGWAVGGSEQPGNGAGHPFIEGYR
jgi:hypothetical protein